MVNLNVDKLLEQKGKTRYWLVKKLGTDYPSVNKMVNKQTSAIYFDTLEKLCDIFDCDFNALFVREED